MRKNRKEKREFETHIKKSKTLAVVNTHTGDMEEKKSEIKIIEKPP